ncbi:hypothetical protein EDP2_3955 [Enterobacter cloacae S611]|uniref:Uncharacterized protein n=1 Tax=Enterobacter cloacae S611 TaxID=1399146 RepID=A0ABN0QB53_ENTCL|nr:hypothetical protein EDP2_3955 [Enterobacter cloacae S611]
MIFVVDIDAQRAVIGFYAGAPRSRRGGRVGDVIGFTAFFVQRVVGVLTSQRQRIDTFKETARPFGIISRGGNFGIAHAVANQQNNIFSRFIVEGITQGGCLIARQTACAAGCGNITLGRPAFKNGRYR